MILGFAHLTKNVGRQVGGPTVLNPPEKWPLMALEAASYRVELRSGELRHEYIRYDAGVVSRPGRLSVEAGRPILAVRDRIIEGLFLREGLGFQAADESEGRETLLRLWSQLPHWQIVVVLKTNADAPIDPPLDIAGYAALAFYSNDVEADRDLLLKHGGRTPTEPFTVRFDEEMKIVMLRSPEGTIIELIQVKGKA